MSENLNDKEQQVKAMTTASAFAMPRPFDDVHNTHSRIWEGMSEETLSELMEKLIAEGSIQKNPEGSYKVNFAVIEKDSDLSKVMTAFVDFFAPQAFYAEMEFRERIEIPTTENRILVLDDLEGTLKARNIVS